MTYAIEDQSSIMSRGIYSGGTLCWWHDIQQYNDEWWWYQGGGSTHSLFSYTPCMKKTPTLQFVTQRPPFDSITPTFRILSPKYPYVWSPNNQFPAIPINLWTKSGIFITFLVFLWVSTEIPIFIIFVIFHWRLSMSPTRRPVDQGA